MNIFIILSGNTQTFRSTFQIIRLKLTYPAKIVCGNSHHNWHTRILKLFYYKCAIFLRHFKKATYEGILKISGKIFLFRRLIKIPFKNGIAPCGQMMLCFISFRTKAIFRFKYACLLLKFHNKSELVFAHILDWVGKFFL